MSVKKAFVYITIFIVIILIASLIVSNNLKNKTISESINFKVERVEVSHSLRCYYYNEAGTKLILPGHTFFAPSKINKGDIIMKKANSSTVVIYRIDSTGKKYVIEQFKL